MNHLKNFYEKQNEGWSLVFAFCGAFFLYKFLKGVFSNRDISDKLVIEVLRVLRDKEKDKIGIIEYDDRYFIRTTLKNGELYDVRILKDTKKMIAGNNGVAVFLTNKEFEEFLSIINIKK